jgi:hypothetical protein
MTLRINDGADDKKNAADGETTTVDNTTLSHVSQMITDIAESYREADDIVNAGNKRNFYCPPFPRKKHGVEDLLCMVSDIYLHMTLTCMVKSLILKWPLCYTNTFIDFAKPLKILYVVMEVVNHSLKVKYICI